MQLKYRRILITGTSRGIGKELARLFLAAGGSVIGTSRNPESAAAHTMPNADNYTVCRLDLADRESVKNLPDRTGPVDLLIHNAGISQLGPCEDIVREPLDNLFSINLMGIIELNRLYIPLMRQQGGGGIIVMNSMAAFIPVPYSGFYAASKAALRNYIAACRMEMRPWGISCCSVFFDYVKTTLPQIPTGSGTSVHVERIRKVSGKRNLRIERGKEPAYIAGRVLDLCTTDRLPAESFIGSSAKLMRLLSRVLPVTFIERMVSRIFLA